MAHLATYKRIDILGSWRFEILVEIHGRVSQLTKVRTLGIGGGKGARTPDLLSR